MISWFARNHVAANLLMIGIVVAGLLAIKKDIPLEFLPDIELGTVNITTVLPGGNPKSIEQTITARIEESIADLQGIKKVVSISSENVSQVIAEIEKNYDKDAVLNDIKVRVDALNNLPSAAERPKIEASEVSVQVIGVVLWGAVDYHYLYETTEQLRQSLLQQDGITQIGNIQAPGREIHIEVPPQNLNKYGLQLSDVGNAIQTNSMDISAGNLRTSEGDILIRANHQAYTKKDFENIPIVNSEDQVVYLKDIANIDDGFELVKVESSYDRQPALTFEIYRVSTENTLTVANTALQFLEQYTPPQGIKMTTYGNTADIVSERLNTLVSSALQGGILVLILLSLFLRPAVAFWVGIGIPVCFLGAFAIMPSFGLSLNMLSMFAYILVLGIVVDDAIVTGENIYRHNQLGMPPAEAAIFGTKEVAVPVTFGVITTMIAFTPLLLISGPIGDLAKQIPLVVIPVLMLSLVESKLILPAHMSTVTPRKENIKSKLGRAQKAFAHGFEQAILVFYRPLLHQCLKNKTVTLLIAIGLFFVTITSTATGWLKVDFFPSFDDNAIIINLSMPSTTGYETTKGHIEHINRVAEQLSKEYINPVNKETYFKNRFSVSGLSFGPQGSSIGTNKGIAYIELKTVEEGLPDDFSMQELREVFRKRIGIIPGALKFEISSNFSDFGRPISITLYGGEPSIIEQKTIKIRHYLQSFPNLFDIQDNLLNGKEEIKIELTPLALSLGIQQVDIANQVRNAIFGYEAQRIQRNHTDIKVMVRYPEQYRTSIPDLRKIKINIPNSNETIPLSDLATLTPSAGPTSIYHDRLRRAVTINADVNTKDTDVNILREKIREFLEDELSNEPSIRFTLDGQAEAQKDTINDFLLGFLIVVLAIYALLAIPFKSFGQPLIVMSIIPLAMAGALWGHYIMGIHFSALSIMGILGLTGIVVNDSLVLVDYINKQRAKGKELMDAVLCAGETRFRPVMLTSLTTFVGLLPLMLNTSSQARALIPMAISLGFGIIFATFITLIITPVTYAIGRAIKYKTISLFKRKAQYD